MQWYWWTLLIAGGYLAMFILIAKLTSKRGLRISLAATICAIILWLPFTDPPASHFISVVAVAATRTRRAGKARLALVGSRLSDGVLN